VQGWPRHAHGAHALEVADFFTERRALAHVFHGFFKRTFGESQADGGVQYALGIKRRQQFFHAVVADHQVFDRQFDVVENDV
jgi:hypothetical protein